MQPELPLNKSVLADLEQKLCQTRIRDVTRGILVA